MKHLTNRTRDLEESSTVNQDLTKQKVITLKNEFKEIEDEIKANKTGVKGTIQDSRGKIFKK